MKQQISHDIKDTIIVNEKEYVIFNLNKLKDQGIRNLHLLPKTIKVLLEAVVRNTDEKVITQDDILALANWMPKQKERKEIPFIPARVILQDFTGVPAVVDLAAMRSALGRLGGNPAKINPLVPVDLVIDHSVQVDFYGRADARMLNEKKEFERNNERYLLLKWAQEAFENFRVVPPGRGIVHQINLENLAQVVQIKEIENDTFAFPDTLVGTDSHTTMINGLGVLGWGVGGIEAEAVMLGQPYYMPIPDVIGVRLIGELDEKSTATDLVLTITQVLREFGVVGKFVEFFGPGMKSLSLPDRATISNMSPEYGATCGFFPIDNQTLKYLELSGRSKEQVALIKAYCTKQGLFYSTEEPDANYTHVLEFDLSSVKPSLAGPKRPQDRILLNKMQEQFHKDFTETYNKDISEHRKIYDENQNRWNDEGGSTEFDVKIKRNDDDHKETIRRKTRIGDTLSHGSVVIAAITSCTNTSNPFVLLAAGLLAKNARSKGLKKSPFVKTSFAPGSRVVVDYLTKAGLLSELEELGFHIVGFGCTTCIGNSGPLDEEIAKKISDDDLVVASVLSGNRNFEGRINPYTKANYLASPILVVAYAIAGTIHIDFDKEPLGIDQNGHSIYLDDIWPERDKIQQLIQENVDREMFVQQYSEIYQETEKWNLLKATEEKSYKWDEKSSYIKEPPFFIDFPLEAPEIKDILDARLLVLLGDSITTDHISPAGAIPENDPAGLYLKSLNIQQKDFNSFGSRRGNHEVMIRGTFGNIRLRNNLVPQREGGWTKHFTTGEVMSIYDASVKYQNENTPLLIIAGKEYGTGSSRDWAAKGTQMLGVKAVIAESYERIHRSNLVGMGVLPLQFTKGVNADVLEITGEETFDIFGLIDISPNKELTVIMKDTNGVETEFDVLVRLDSEVEIDYYKNGGILHTVLRDMVKQ